MNHVFDSSDGLRLWAGRIVLMFSAVSALALSATASAQAPRTSLNLSFAQPVGTVGQTDAIPIELVFRNTDASLPFVVDPALPVFGLAPEFVPAEGIYWDPVTQQITSLPFATYTAATLTLGISCVGSTFTSSCFDGPPYDFAYAESPFPAGSTAFTLQAGQSMGYLLGNFTPTGGSAVAPGTYRFFDTQVWLYIDGQSSSGIALRGFVLLASTCGFADPVVCDSNGWSHFARTVEVPEPASVALWLCGLLAVAGAARRRDTSLR